MKLRGKCNALFSRGIDSKALLEPFCRGVEFTVVVLESLSGDPVALIPTEIEIRSGASRIFDFRKKYLPTDNTLYHTPPRFEEERIQAIRTRPNKYLSFSGCGILSAWTDGLCLTVRFILQT